MKLIALVIVDTFATLNNFRKKLNVTLASLPMKILRHKVQRQIPLFLPFDLCFLELQQKPQKIGLSKQKPLLKIFCLQIQNVPCVIDTKPINNTTHFTNETWFCFINLSYDDEGISLNDTTRFNSFLIF